MPFNDITRREFLKDVAIFGGGGRVSGVFQTPGPMLRRSIPHSSEQLPVIGLGTWRTFDPASVSLASLAPLEATLRVFHDVGGRVIDSSPMYGKSEELSGRL